VEFIEVGCALPPVANGKKPSSATTKLALYCGGGHDNKFGHLIFSPSNHRMYSSSAIGERLTGEASAALSPPGVVGVVAVVVPEGPAMSSTTSVTTRPRFVISLFRVTRLWGKRPLEVCTCCLIAALLRKAQSYKPENKPGRIRPEKK
jgi:hypothetical protein